MGHTPSQWTPSKILCQLHVTLDTQTDNHLAVYGEDIHAIE